MCFSWPTKLFQSSAALTALALFAAFRLQAEIDVIDLTKPIIMGGLLIGAMLPFVFSALSMNAVGRAAKEMIIEVGRQFREIKGLREGTAEAEYSKCVEISTKASGGRMIDLFIFRNMWLAGVDGLVIDGEGSGSISSDWKRMCLSWILICRLRICG